MKIALIGQGAIAQYVASMAGRHGYKVASVLLRTGREPVLAGVQTALQVSDVPRDVDLVVDCAGHSALRMYGPNVLQAGFDLLTVSIGALAQDDLAAALEAAAIEGRSKLHLASGAIGALDCLSAAKIGKLDSVKYIGRKPPKGWAGSPAEQKLDLASLSTGQSVHFEGPARQAAIEYPKNANVAAAVALAGLGLDDTHVVLIADASIDANIHEIHATGAFGTFQFQISGNTLPDNPRTSALAAMSVVSKIVELKENQTHRNKVES